MLTLEGIEKRYGGTLASNRVTLELADGESLVFAGESGCGKTTRTKCAVGMESADAGSVVLDGRPLAPSCRRRSFGDCANIQYIFQDPYSALEGNFSLEKTLGETARICRRHGRNYLPAEEALSYVDHRLLDYLNRPVRELSGGQRQKVCIARALMPLPRVIIADESTSMLDRQSGLDIFELLNRIKEEKGVGLLCILHDVDFSYTRWDRIAVMWRGQLVEQLGFAEFPRCAAHSYSRQLLEAFTYFNGRNGA